MTGVVVVLLVLAVLLLGIGALLALSYNRLVRLRSRAREAWSGIDVQLTRRAELVPNLVRVVEGSAAHERETLAEVTAARAEMVAAEGPRSAGEADDQLEGALGRLFAVAESYPELRASDAFLRLQRDLVALEEEISFARRYHNATVEDLNTAVESVPTNVVAGLFGFERRELFKADAADRAAPDVAEHRR